MPTYFEQKYCNKCVAVHWCEVTRTGRVICHGYSFAPAETETHYTRRLGHGIELVRKSKHWEPKPQPLPLAWQMRESVEIDF
jgi:hypothetical protein